MELFFPQNMDGTVTGSWEGIRVHAIATHPASDLVYAADTHSRIRQYSFRDKSSSTLWVEHPSLGLNINTGFSFSPNSLKPRLVSYHIHVWEKNFLTSATSPILVVIQFVCQLSNQTPIWKQPWNELVCTDWISHTMFSWGRKGLYIWSNLRRRRREGLRNDDITLPNSLLAVGGYGGRISMKPLC